MTVWLVMWSQVSIEKKGLKLNRKQHFNGSIEWTEEVDAAPVATVLKINWKGKMEQQTN